MNISVKIEGLDGVLDKLGSLAAPDRMRRALEAAGEVVSADAKANCPVDTGYLRNSISVSTDGNSAVIGPSAEYGIYVEFGTGAHGDAGVAHTSKKQWTYYSRGGFYTTSGQPPRPFLVPALKNNVAEIARRFREAY